MEKKIRLNKNGISKFIPENLVSEYLQLGWKKAEKVEKTAKIKLVENKYEREV